MNVVVGVGDGGAVGLAQDAGGAAKKIVVIVGDLVVFVRAGRDLTGVGVVSRAGGKLRRRRAARDGIGCRILRGSRVGPGFVLAAIQLRCKQITEPVVSKVLGDAVRGRSRCQVGRDGGWVPTIVHAATVTSIVVLRYAGRTVRESDSVIRNILAVLSRVVSVFDDLRSDKIYDVAAGVVCGSLVRVGGRANGACAPVSASPP